MMSHLYSNHKWNEKERAFFMPNSHLECMLIMYNIYQRWSTKNVEGQKRSVGDWADCLISINPAMSILACGPEIDYMIIL